MKKTGLFYARFMDDWVVLSPSRWKLRKAVSKANRVLEQLKVEKHPDKTFIGRVARGFDFLGYHFTPLTTTDPSFSLTKSPKHIKEKENEKKVSGFWGNSRRHDS